MKSEVRTLSGASLPATERDCDGLGYPASLMVVFGVALALAVLWLVAPLGTGTASILTVAILLVTLAFVWLRTRRIVRARAQSAQVLAALGAETSTIPVKLRTRMPLVLVSGDGLTALFNRGEQARYVYVGDGAIWLRVDRPQDLPQLAVAVRQWRNGRAPDGIVLSVAPALHVSSDLLAQKLRVVRQAVADAARLLGTRLPGYVAIYQRLTTGSVTLATPKWYGVSSATRLTDTQRFEAVMRAAENEVQGSNGDRTTATRAAALASVIGWTQRVVFDGLTDPRHPAGPLALYGAGWIDCGPVSGAGRLWEREVESRTRVVPAAAATTSPIPWPLPQPLIEALPQRAWMPPRLAAALHAIALTACAAALAFWSAANNNEALLTRIGADLGRYAEAPAANDAAKRDALQALVANRNQLERYGRTGVPLRLSFGMYRGAQLVPILDKTIASYQPPPPPPAVVTLDSMSLFDSGAARLKPGSTRAMVQALDMIKSHPDKRILVAGYTDNVGGADSNLKLSVARAGAVRDWLIEASGIATTQFAVQGYGDTRPIATNDTPEGRARNRRVEITLVPDSGR